MDSATADCLQGDKITEEEIDVAPREDSPGSGVSCIPSPVFEPISDGA